MPRVAMQCMVYRQGCTGMQRINGIKDLEGCTVYMAGCVGCARHGWLCRGRVVSVIAYAGRVCVGLIQVVQ